MKTVLNLLLAGSFLALCNVCTAVENIQTITIDAESARISQSVDASATKIKLIVRNVIPAQRTEYEIKSENTPVSVEPLSPNFEETLKYFPKVETTGKIRATNDAPCISLADNTQELLKISPTKPISDLVRNILQDIEDAEANLGNDETCDNNVIESAKRAIEKTQLVFELSVKPNQKTVITVIKPNKNDTIAELTYPGISNKFLTHVGFTFVDNQGTSWYSQVNEDGSAYTVTEQHHQDEWLFSPTVLFTYKLHSIGTDDIQGGITGGIGANQENVFAYLGYSIVIHDNIIVSLGGAMQEFQNLSGRYYDGQVLDTAVDSTELNSKSFDAAASFSLGFRFAF